jgi:voltage-gated potassium channel
LRANIVTAISLVIPALRIFRITAAASAFRVARGLRLARMVTSVNRTMLALQQITRHGGFRYVILLTVAIVLTGSAGIYAFEKDADSGIRDFGTALWWTSMMMTTMGSDSWPRTPEGRLLTVLLALYAFAVFGYVTATIATFLIGRDADQTRAGRASQTEMRLVLQELIELRAAVAEVRQLSRSPKNVLADRGLRATGRPQTGGTGEP